MHDAHEFLRSLTIVLAVGAFTAYLFQRIKQPVVLGYLIAGLLVGPYVPVGFVADKAIVQTLSEMGVILLMFSLGLEFSLRKLVQMGSTAGLTAAIQAGIVAWLGFLVGRLFDWGHLESIFLGVAIAISSTTIIAKVFDEQKVTGRLRDLVVGILLFEDLIAVIGMAALTAVATGGGLSAADLALTIGRLGLFLVLLVGVGIVVIPRAMRAATTRSTPEIVVVMGIGICFLMAFLAQEAGYSVALGAFMAGSLMAEGGLGEQVDHAIKPVRDLFAAVFFVSVGMLIDPALLMVHWQPILVLTLVVVFGKIFSVALGAFLAGTPTRTAIQAGMSLAQIGEFSFIIATLGLSLGRTGDYLFPVVVAVSAITTLLTPWLVKNSGRVASAVDRRMPPRLQTLTSLYGSWLDRPRKSAATRRGFWRVAGLLLIDAAVLSGIVVGASLYMGTLVEATVSATGVTPTVARAALVVLAGLIAAPLVLGIGRLGRRLGDRVAQRAFPPVAKGLDLNRTPRQVLTLVLQLVIVLLTGMAVVAFTQPFLPNFTGPVILVVFLAGYAAAIWRRASDLDGHVKAGAEVVVAGLARQAQAGALPERLEMPGPVKELLPGIGAPMVVTLSPHSHAVGQTLAELELRGRTGAMILAISRAQGSIPVPGPNERLEAGDRLAVAGSHESIEAAERLLLDGDGQISAPSVP
ncbi:MAG: cation:proton antiporter domain-containing protein [Gemmatimonadales bacterium]